MASKRRNMFHKNKTQETTENGVYGGSCLRCYQCGQYTDGVGSITPCINYTARVHLKECPQALSQHCIKYVSEGSTVRECAAECIEQKEAWGTKVFCCSEDGCNRGIGSCGPDGLLVLAALLVSPLFLPRH